MSKQPRYEVQTHTLCDGWINCWTIEDNTEYFATEQEAQDAIYEFFADLSRAGLSAAYRLEDYRVVRTDALSD